MALRITLSGSTGWVGRALVPAILGSTDLHLVSTVSRSAAGRDAGEAAGVAACGVATSATLNEALQVASDVVIDYTGADVVKEHVLASLAAGRAVVVGASGLGGADFTEIEASARQARKGVIAAGNFSLTATLLKRFALEAARYLNDVEIIDYASATKPDTPSGTALELAEALAGARLDGTSTAVERLSGFPGTRGTAVGRPRSVQVHSVRMPSYILSCEAIFGMPDERLVVRHDAGSSAAPYVAGTLLAARKVVDITGLVRGLDSIL